MVQEYTLAFFHLNLTSLKNLSTYKSLPVWGGIECTINRIEDTYYDQLELSGHYNRNEDIPLIASLGIQRLRYPILWEKHQPEEGTTIDWTYTAQRLKQITDAGMTPVAGLIHHGSGPRFTDLHDKHFPEKFAAYAKLVAQQFPWIEWYTPVNEPLTTARFSGLYGFWYPHKKSDRAFVRILINELKATVLAMQAIREINPHAKLLQTEDLSKAYSTAEMSWQAKFENERRWLTVDILSGKLAKGYLMYDYLIASGITEDELKFFNDHPCPPGIMGANYYITSERFLDHQAHMYPPHTHGSNGYQSYADTEAIRAKHNEPWGLKVLIRELWERHGLPIAVTECHLNCHSEEQLRWFKENYESLRELSAEGIDIRGITAWAILGSFGWDHLLTDAAMHYECGVFDVRAGKIRSTAVANLIKNLAFGEEVHPLCHQAGWWRVSSPQHSQLFNINTAVSSGPLLIIGKNGTLAKAFMRNCYERNIPYKALGRDDMNIFDETSLSKLVADIDPWAIVNTAGFVDIDAAEKHKEDCYRLNTDLPKILAAVCKTRNIRLLTYSSDQVFDGKKTFAYVEDDATAPLNVYGHSKALAEKAVMAIDERALIIRTSAFFGPSDMANFAYKVLECLEAGLEFTAAKDVVITPTYVPHLVHHSLNLLIDAAHGIWHLSNGTALSWAGFAKEIARKFDLDVSLIREVNAADLNWQGERPVHAALESHVQLLPPLNVAIDELSRSLEVRPSLIRSA